MTLSTVPDAKTKPVKTKDKIAALKTYHEHIFKKEEAINPKYIPRMCYKKDGEHVIGLFPGDLRGGTDVYIEFCSRDYEPEFVHVKERTLWKWHFNPDYATEYKQSEPHQGTGDKQIYIPTSELINMTNWYKLKEEEAAAPKAKPSTEMIFDTDDDAPYAEMTIRDYMAIHTGKLVSNKQWLNNLIKTTSND
ncbi:unnamed protein product [marine sediment metagenome]|uniref:Uncharacterized protein n=1 Tax=marine sediment metagenome TaxID=412755 RepID=X0U4J5_9ZZZZ